MNWGTGYAQDHRREDIELLNRVPGWLQTITLLFIVAVVARILAPLLSLLPAYLLFGIIFLLGVALILWKKVLTDGRQRQFPRPLSFLYLGHSSSMPQHFERAKMTLTPGGCWQVLPCSA